MHTVVGPHLIIVPWAHLSPHPKWQLHWFSRFCGTHDCDRPTNRWTDRPRYSVCNNRPQLHSTV